MVRTCPEHKYSYCVRDNCKYNMPRFDSNAGDPRHFDCQNARPGHEVAVMDGCDNGGYVSDYAK